MLHGDAAQRHQFARLPDHGVAADGGNRRIPRPDRHGEIERGDDADWTQRVPLLVHAVAGSLGVHGQPVELARETDSKVADVDHLLHLANALDADLAHLQRHQLAQRLAVVAQDGADVAHHLAALGRRYAAPGGKGLARGGDRGVVCGGVRRDDRSYRLAGRRVVGGDGRRAALDPAVRAGTHTGVRRLKVQLFQKSFHQNPSFLQIGRNSRQRGVAGTCLGAGARLVTLRPSYRRPCMAPKVTSHAAIQ